MKHIKYNTQKAKEVDDRVLRFIGSTEDIDRDNESIKLSGWRLKNYKKNGVVLVNHNPMELPVAKTKKVWIDKGKQALMFDIEFPEASISPQGDTLYKLYKSGFMNATSVGFMPNRDKIAYGNRDKGEAGVIFKEVELLEISLVSVPANPAALLTTKGIKDAIEKNIVDQAEITDLEICLNKYLQEQEKKKPEVKINKAFKDFGTEHYKCSSCYEEFKVEVLCPVCHEKHEANKTEDVDNYFKNLYDEIIAGR